MLRIELDEFAEEEWYEAYDYLSKISMAVADRFYSEVRLTLLRIAKNPQMFAKAGKRVRACPVGHFQYRVLYEIFDGYVLIVAIAHAKRRPGYWRKRRKQG